MKPKSSPSIILPSRAARSRDGLTMGRAIGGSPPLARLAERLRDSAERFAVVRSVLPEALMEHVTPGPVDEEGWSLLVANAAVAAKLRQLKPRIEDQLRAHGWVVAEVRIKILPGSG